MDFVTTFNALEALWWTAMGALCWWKSRGVWTSVGRTASMFLLLFALTEVIEIQTGAWWRPWWLAVAKGSCIVGLIVCGVWGLRVRRSSH